MKSALIAILISLIVGGSLWYLTYRFDFGLKISTREFIIGSVSSALFLIIMAPLIEHLIIKDRMTYREYFNGVETQAVDQNIICERDGDCAYTYACDYYVETEIYYTYDEDGNSESHTRLVTKHHDCPYLKIEHAYYVDTTLGRYSIGSRYSDSGRQRWGDKEVPAHVPIGPPDFWAAAKKRIDDGRPGGVTKTHSYKNFLLASDATILKSYSDEIEDYLAKGLLPPHTTNYEDPIYDYYLADKFHSVHLVVDAKQWNEALMRVNGYLGAELQGDLHMVAVDADTVIDRDGYSQALFAYWKGSAFKKNAFPKNAIGLVVGVKNGKVAWSRATTGLPTGNEALLQDLQKNLTGVAFTPEFLLGDPKNEKGVVATQLWGPNKFVRSCMECVQERTDGYAYLKPDIVITGAERFWIIFWGVFLSCALWVFLLYADDSFRSRYGY